MGQVPWFLFPVFFHHFFLLKVLAMNSGQVWLINRLRGRRDREGLGEGRTNSPHPRLGSWRICTGERTWWEAGGGGHRVFRGLSGAALPTKNIYMHSPRWGHRAELPAGHPGDAGATSPLMATLGPSLSISVNLYTVCGLLFTGKRPGEASPGWWLAGEGIQERQGGGGPFCP